MKMASIVVAGLGLLALVFGIVEWFLQISLFGVRMGGYVQGAIALWMLALVIMVFDRNYCRKSEVPPTTKP